MHVNVGQPVLNPIYAFQILSFSRFPFANRSHFCVEGQMLKQVVHEKYKVKYPSLAY